MEEAANSAVELGTVRELRAEPPAGLQLFAQEPPQALTIEDIGELIKDTQDHLKIVQLQDAADKSYTYKLKAPDAEGIYEFSGIYQIDGMDQPADVGGASSLTVSSASAAMTPMTVAAVVIIVVIIIVVLLFLRKSKTIKSQ